MWWLILFFIDKFFIFRLKSEKYTDTNGKDSKYTNTIDISIISFDCTEGCTEGCSEDCFLDCSEDWFLLRNIFSFLFFICAASLWPWATRPGCFSRFIIFSLFFWHFLFNKNNHLTYDSAT